MDSTPYDEGTRVHACDAAVWFDDDRRVIRVGIRAPADDVRGPSNPAELGATLPQVELFILGPSLDERMLVEFTLPQMARFLADPVASARINVTWAQADHWEWVDGSGQSYIDADYALTPENQLAAGEYWLVAAVRLPANSRLGCPSESPADVFSPPVRLSIATALTPKERAFVHYRRIQQILELRATDERNPDYRKASHEQHAREIDAALDSAKKLVDVDPHSSFGWEMLAKVHEMRHEAVPAIAAYRKAAELLAAGVPDIAATEVRGCMADWRTPPRPAQLQQRIDALSLPQPSFSAPP